MRSGRLNSGPSEPLDRQEEAHASPENESQELPRLGEERLPFDEDRAERVVQRGQRQRLHDRLRSRRGSDPTRRRSPRTRTSAASRGSSGPRRSRSCARGSRRACRYRRRCTNEHPPSTEITVSSHSGPCSDTSKTSQPKSRRSTHLGDHHHHAARHHRPEEVAASHRRRDEPLEQLARAHVDEHEADPPHAAAHDVHPEKPGDEEVDVARSRLRDSSLDVRRDGIGAPRGASGARRPRAAPPASSLGTRRVEAVLVRSRPARRRATPFPDAALGRRRRRTRAPRWNPSVRRSARTPSSAPAPSTTPTEISSGALLRNAMPRPTASRIGNPNTQNSTSGLAHELAQSGEEKLDGTDCGSHSSRRCLPVRDTKTSSRLACLVLS